MPKTKFSLNAQIGSGAVLGVLGGLWIAKAGPAAPPAPFVLSIAEILGGIFVNLLKMILIPLVFTSISIGIANLRAHRQMHRVWKITFIYFLASPTLAVILGLTVINIVKPGVGMEISMFQEAMSDFRPEEMTPGNFLKIFLLNLFMNPFEAMAKGDVLSTLVFAIFIGIGMIVAGEKARAFRQFLSEAFELIMIIVEWIMRLAPIGIMALLLKLIATQDLQILSSLAKFIAVVLGCTLFHGLVTLPGALYLLTGFSPLRFFKEMREALITAVSTSSSSATLPISMHCVEKNLKVDKDIAGFVLPLGTTANMDGTALYEAAAALFIANLVGIELTLVQQIVVALMAIIASIGAPGIPSAGMVTMIMVLQSVGLPIEAIAILLPIDRPLDAIRTMVNVEGDGICSLIVQRYANQRR